MILVPARNEGPRVGAVVRAARAALPGVPLLVVVNGCTDDTAQRAAEAGATIFTCPPGYANALKAGYQHAVDRWDRGASGPRWVVQLDADGQHPAEALPDLIAALDGHDLVIGSRFGGGSNGGAGPLRRAGILALGAWASFLSGRQLRDVTSGMQAISERLVRHWAVEFPAELVDANLLVRASRQGYDLIEVPVPMRSRSGGRGMHDSPAALLHALRVGAASAVEAWRR